MAPEEKQLLLQELCARLPYGVKVQYFDVTKELLGIIPSTENVMVGYDINDYENSFIEDIKPYLRPMSSMTKKEYDEVKYPEKFIDWLNAHHFDYRGLIEKGLAIEAPEGMYN